MKLFRAFLVCFITTLIANLVADYVIPKDFHRSVFFLAGMICVFVSEAWDDN